MNGAASAPTSSDGDHYRTLGVSPHATTREIHRAYRSLALTLHPDKQRPHRGDTEQQLTFQQLHAAYHALIDDSNRAEYDAQRQGQSTINRAARRILVASAASDRRCCLSSLLISRDVTQCEC